MNNQNNRNFTAPYAFVEYPKWVTLADGSQVMVHNTQEEQILTATSITPQSEAEEEAAKAACAAQEAERQVLIAQAKDMGLLIHPKTGLDKLREKIAAAQE